MDRAPAPRSTADERALLLGWLAFQRDTLAWKCAGLTPAQLVTASVPPSNLTLLGLVRHMTEMERHYLVHGVGGAADTLRYCGDDPEGDFEGVAGADPDEDMAAWLEDRARADETIATVADLAAPGAGNGAALRWNLLKVLGEYARHNGHADLLRQRIDGAVGE